MKTSIETQVTEGRKLNRVINFRGVNHNITLHLKLYTYPDYSFELIDKVTNDKGVEIIGVWQHGRSGAKMHKERLLFDTRNGADFKWFGATVTYQNGRKKDSYKYLISIEEVK